MAYSVMGSVNGRYEIRDTDTAAKAGEIADQFKAADAFPVRIKKDGVLIESPRELDELIKNETSN